MTSRAVEIPGASSAAAVSVDRCSSTSVRCAKLFVAGILISAGLLKLHELLLYRGGWGAVVLEAYDVGAVTALLVELFCGFLFLLARPQKLLWLSGATMLVMFAFYNIKLLAEDKPSCGCFGVVSVHPWVSLSFDLVGAALLVSTLRSVPATPWRTAFSLADALRPAMYTVILTTGYSVVEQCLYLSPVGVRVRNETITVLPESLWLGEVAMGRYHEARIGLRNNAGHAIKLVGGTSNCSCYAIKELPIVLSSGETGYVRVDVFAPRRRGSFSVRVKFFADLGTVRILSCQAKGRAVDDAGVVLLDSQPRKGVKGE